MNVIRLLPEHVRAIVPQSAQHHLPDDYIEALRGTSAYTAEVDGKIICAAGVVEEWPGRGLAWALLSKDIGPYMVGITRAVRRYLEASPIRRIEMAVECDFAAGHRWAKMLGFRLECERMQAYTTDGRDCALYVRVR